MRPHRLLSLFLFSLAPAALARRVFFASAVSYCSPARAIEVERFLLSFDVDANSISFDISAASVEPNLDASLSFQLSAYGINAVNVTIELCGLLGGVLCPLPQYDFVGSATIPLPAGVTGDIDIPAIGYVIPDLEATAFVRLIKVADGTEAACLKVDLSNGLSTRHKGVSWALGGLAIGSLLVGVLGGIVVLSKRGEVEKGRSKERFVGMLSFFQFVASTGLLSLVYPLVFTSFTANFAWCIGLIYVRPVQVGIDNLRERTGGNLTQIAGTIVGGTRALEANSRFQTNLAQLSSSSPSSPSSSLTPDIPTTLVQHLATQITSTASRLIKRALEIPTVRTNNLDVVSLGIPRYGTNAGISPFNAYMTVFVTFLLLLCIFLAFVLVLSIPFVNVARRGAKRNGRENVSLRQGYFYSLLRANALRLLLIVWFPLLIFTFFQWTLGRIDSWAPILLSVLTILTTTAAIVFLSFLTIIRVRRGDRNSLLASGAGPTAPLWNAFKPTRWWFFLVTLTATFVRAFFISFARGHGWVQTIGLLVIESLVFLAMCIFTPFSDKSSNGTNITIQILRIVVSGGLIVFNASLGLNEILRVAIGIVLIVIESLVVVGFFLLVVIDAVSILVRAIRKRPDGVKREEMAERPSESNESIMIAGDRYEDTEDRRAKAAQVEAEERRS